MQQHFLWQKLGKERDYIPGDMCNTAEFFRMYFGTAPTPVP
jgi:hypothetical protein